MSSNFFLHNVKQLLQGLEMFINEMYSNFSRYHRLRVPLYFHILITYRSTHEKDELFVKQLSFCDMNGMNATNIKKDRQRGDYIEKEERGREWFYYNLIKNRQI